MSFSDRRVTRRRSPKAAEGLVLSFGSLLFLMGAVVILGWYGGHELLTRFHPSFMPMSVSTAWAFIFAGAGFLSLLWHRPWFSFIFACLLILIGGVCLLEGLLGQVWGWHHGFFNIFFPKHCEKQEVMAVLNAFCVFLAGLSLGLFSLKWVCRSRAVFFIGIFGIFMLLLGLVVFCGHLMPWGKVTIWNYFSGTEFHEALGIILMGLTVIFWAWRSERRLWLLTAIVGIGMFVSIAMFAIEIMTLEERTSNVFQTAAQDRVDAVQRELDLGFLAVESLKAFFEGSQYVDPQEFKRFAGILMRENHSILALEWIPRVPVSEKISYEQREAEETGVPNFKIGSRINIEKRAISEGRDEFFPIRYVEPFEKNRDVVGRDYRVDDYRWDYLAKSRKNASAVASPKIKKLTRKEGLDEQGFFIADSVFRLDEDNLPKEEGFEGFVLALFRIPLLVKTGLSYLSPQGLNLYIYDVTETKTRTLLFYHPARIGALDEKPLSWDQISEYPGYRYADWIDVVDRKWQIVCLPADDFMSTEYSTVPWVILILGIFLTSFLTVYIYLLTRTGDELSELNARLSLEIKDKERAEEVLRNRSEELTELNQALEEFNQTAVGREERMIELKRKVNALCVLLGKDPEYDLSKLEREEPSPDDFSAES